MTESRRRDWFALAFVAFLPTLLFLDVVLGKGVFFIRDVALYHFPGKRILREIVLRGEFPYWNAWVSAGQPLAANPAHEVFYPLTWLILLPDFVYGFQLLALIHVHVAAVATYLLLRSLAVSRASSVFGALAFGLGGFILSGLHLFPFLFSAAWMPLTFLYGRRAILGRAPRDFALAAFFLGMQCLVGEPVVVLQTGVVLGMYAIAVAVEERRAAGAARNLGIVAAIGVAALLLAAVQILPGFDHARDSVRADGFTFDYVSDWSTPPIRFAELLFPDVFGSRVIDSREPSWGRALYGKRTLPYFPAIYAGIFAFVLSFAGVFARVRGRGLFLAIGAVSIVLAMGSHTPLLRFLYEAGLARSIRYPEKFLIMGLFAMAVYAAIALDNLLANDRLMRGVTLATCIGVSAAAIIGFATTLLPAADQGFRSFWQIADSQDVGPLLGAARRGWLLAVARGVIVLAAVAILPRLPRRTAAALVLALVAADLSSQVTAAAPRTNRDFYLQPPMTLAQLPLQRSDYRVFVIGDVSSKTLNRQEYLARRPHHFLLQRNALVGLTPATYGIRSAFQVDYDLTSLRSTEAFVTAMWALSERSGDWLNYLASMSNVWYIGLYRPFEQAVEEAGGDARLLRPIRWVAGRTWPRFYFASQVVPIASPSEFVDKLATGTYPRDAAFIAARDAFAPAAGRVLGATETPNTARIEVESRGPSFLVMSVSGHKYWSTTIDGVDVPTIPTNLGYQGVVVPGGRHVVEMRYHNPLIAAGAGVSAAAFLALLAVAFRRSRLSTMRTL